MTEDGVVTSKLSGSYIPCFSVYVKSLSEITQYSEDLHNTFIIISNKIKKGNYQKFTMSFETTK